MTAGTVDSGHPVHAQPTPPATSGNSPQGDTSTRDIEAPASTELLADRVAAALVHRDPGWRLPRRSALAKRYDVSVGEIDAAIDALARRSLVRRLPDGQLYRASPAEHWISIEGARRLGTRLDPMGNTIDCQARQMSQGEPPPDIAAALGLPDGVPVNVVRCVWSAAGDPVALSTAYLHGPMTEGDNSPDREAELPSFGSVLHARPAAAVSVEVGAPQPTVAHTLRLTAEHPVFTVTIRFDDSATRTPAGLTLVVMKPELFRVAIDTTEARVIAPLSQRCRRGRRTLRHGCRRRPRPLSPIPAFSVTTKGSAVTQVA